jgi:hypothetical protein
MKYKILVEVEERYTNFYTVECDPSEIDAIAAQCDTGTYGEANDRELNGIETIKTHVFTLDSTKGNG